MNKRFMDKKLYSPLLFAVMLAAGNVICSADVLTDTQPPLPKYSAVTIENKSFSDYKSNTSGAVLRNETSKDLLNVNNAVFSNNSYSNQFQQSGSFNSEEFLKNYYSGGGAIANRGTLNVRNSIFENNSASSSFKFDYKLTPETYDPDNVIVIGNRSAVRNGESVETENVNETGDVVQVHYPITGITYYTLNSSQYLGGGGAIANYKDAYIYDSKFINNHSANLGGAVFNAKNASLKVLGNNEFIGNKAYSEYSLYQTDLGDGSYLEHYDYSSSGMGGAIYSEGDLVVDGAKFVGNTAAEEGGAIYSTVYSLQDSENAKNTLTINNSVFENNIAKSKYDYKGHYSNPPQHDEVHKYAGIGGAVSTDTNTQITNSVFTNNYAAESGGAVEFYDTGVKNTKFLVENSIFTSNKAGESGGAIKLQGDNASAENAFNAELKIIGSAFINNSVEADDSFIPSFVVNGQIDTGHLVPIGGAVANFSNSPVTISDSKFIGNSAFSELKPFSPAYKVIDTGIGGAVYSNGELNISGTSFTNNHTSDMGGAVFANNTLTIDNSSFVGNSAVSKTVYAEDNIELITGNGGAVYINGSDAVITDTDFIGNTAGYNGGAVYITNKNHSDDISASDIPTATIIAKNKDVIFKDNKAQDGADIYLQNTKLNLNAVSNKTISFDGGISAFGRDFNTININDNTVYANSTGNIIFNAPVVPLPDSTLAVNVKGGTISLGDESYLDGTDLTLESGSTLNLANNKTGLMKINNIISNNANLTMDAEMNGKNGYVAIDTIFAENNASGTLNLTSLNILSDFDSASNGFVSGFGNAPQIVTQKELNVLTNDYLYTVNAYGDRIEISRLVDADNKAVQLDGFAVAINGTANVGGTDIDLSEQRTFSANSDIDITGSGVEGGWNGNLGGTNTNLTINGNGYSINGNQNVGITIDDGQSITINDASIVDFKTDDTTKGILTVKSGGSLEINAINNNIEIDSADKNSNAIYLDGTNSSALLSTATDKVLEVKNDVRSADKSNEITLKGMGKIIFKGIVDPLTINNENENTVHDNYIDDISYNLNSGAVSFTKDKYLANRDGNKNSINFNGGALNIANGEVNNIALANLKLSAGKTSNISVDADLASEKMDRLSADTYTIGTDGILNVSNINLLSDANKDKTSIQFASDELKGSVTTSVRETAYSPIYKYNVGYDPATGEFTFNRGASSKYNNINPSVMAAAVAAQAGGYLTLLNAYDQAFSNMDMTMSLPKTVRQAIKDRNKFASAGAQKPYASVEIPEEDLGLWARPYSTFESVALRGGPRVSNVMYGTFMGGDSGLKELGHGFDGVFGVYTGYNGSHQAYQGNSIYQNGGALGATGTLYKGNWFGALTANVGANGANASTRYGSEDFAMLLAGTAIKTGYNWDLFNSKLIFQPSYLMSYSFVNTFDYHNAAGINITSDPLNAIQIVPGLKLIGNCPNGWQPYVGFNFIWNIIDKTRFQANDVSLPELAVRPYVEYGLGVQKRWGERFTGYGQAMFRSGGREGVGFSLGLRSKLGK